MIQELDEERVVCELFSVTEDEARNAILSAGREIKSIQRYFRKRANKVGVCKYCGRKLTDNESVMRGCGKTCYNRIHNNKEKITLEV